LTRFVGREAELAQMRRALERARNGHGQVVAAVGEPGVGKSRLFFEFKAIAEGGCLVLEAYSISHGKASAYLPVIELLRCYFQIAAEDDERRRREKVAGKVLVLDRLRHRSSQAGQELAGRTERQPGRPIRERARLTRSRRRSRATR
jgi:predicted ATPase